MCDLSHNYTVEVVGQSVRYTGTEEDDAISALLSISDDEEGYVVAEHEVDGPVRSNGPGVAYCPAESIRIENEAIKAQADMEAKWAQAHEAFHGEGPYALANQGW